MTESTFPVTLEENPRVDYAELAKGQLEGKVLAIDLILIIRAYGED